MPLEPGQVVDQYRLDQTIHRGRATIVYAATDTGLGRKVAFKVLAERYATDDVIRQRFVNEAQVAASLDGHPHIVTVYKWGEFEGSMYFVTELIDGISLAELLERQPGGRPLQPNEALGLLTQVADALDFAHKRGAIHRDVKPANVMVKMTDTPRTAYLVDFGITKMDDGETGPQGMFLGTPDYASPEQISGAQALDRRSDVYSLACTAFEVLTGRPPFGDAPNDAARIAAHLQSPVPSARALRAELPPAIDDVFAKALAKNREDRYASCGEFVRQLRSVFPEGTHIFRRPPPPGADLPTPSLYTPDMAPRRKWPWVALGVVAAVLITTVAYFVTSRRTPNNQHRDEAGVDHDDVDHDHHDEHDDDHHHDDGAHDDRARTVRGDRWAGRGDRFPGGELRRWSANPADRKRGGSPGLGGAAVRRMGQIGRREAPDGPVRSLEDDGFLVTVDEPVALRDVQLSDTGLATDVRECRAEGECRFISDSLVPDTECEPADGCATVDSRNGSLRAVHVATLVHGRPAVNYVYLLRTEQEITGIFDPGGNAKWDGKSDYLILAFGQLPRAYSSEILTVSYADGGTDQLIMNFEIPLPASSTTTIAPS